FNWCQRRIFLVFSISFCTTTRTVRLVLYIVLMSFQQSCILEKSLYGFSMHNMWIILYLFVRK
ncbi:hypothetical protein BD770DRAFT_404597, partial [Pilaira anomala]